MAKTMAGCPSRERDWQVKRLAQLALSLAKDDAIALAASGWALAYVLFANLERRRPPNLSRACCSIPMRAEAEITAAGKKLSRRAGTWRSSASHVPCAEST